MVLDLLLIGLGITLEPFPLVAFVLVLSAERGVRKALAFILAWLACLVGVIAAVLLLTGGHPPAHKTGGSTAAITVKLVVGVGLIMYGEYKRRTAGRPRKTPKWLARLHEVNSWTAAGLAVLLQPWGLVAAGAATVVEANLNHGATYLALLGFCLVATASQLTLELYAVFAPRTAGARLERLSNWLDNHHDQAIVVLSLLIGFWLVGKSISQLV
ncbi:GAP family protein [Streptomyces sp. NPDC058001]|uniref:GAP family protein n=1 Tax=Streptomyces sp. NPDC058001 TaxID=3346300 RepID=UPI0036E37AE4